MMLFLYIGLVIALPAALGAYIVFEKCGREDPTAGFMLILLSSIMALGFGVAFQSATLFEFRYDIGSPSVLIVGLLLGGLVGIAHRRRTAAPARAVQSY